ncbi:MAG: hypothetical protein ABJP48_03900 [Erythrobacter sp.]
MSEVAGPLAPLERFAADWRGALETGAGAVIQFAELEPNFAAPHAVADAFVKNAGFTPIGFNWEMLDASDSADGQRAAQTVISGALANNMVMPGVEWLGEKRALACAQAFLGAFNPAQRTVLSNRLEGLWNPISTAALEWAFTGFDDQKIALLLVTAEG